MAEEKSFAGVFNAIAESIQRLDGGGDMTPSEMSLRIDGIPERESVANKVSSLEGTFETDDQYPSAKAVKDALDTKIGKGEGPIKTLPKYLHEISFDDTYPADAEEWYRSLSPNAFGGSCSAVVRNGKLYRNYDWTFDNTAEFVVRVSSSEDRHASIGIASLGSALTEAEAASGEYTPKFRVLPGMTLDGINDAGVVAEINVDGGPKSGWHGSGENSIHILAAVRWVLDHGETAEQAAEYIAENIRQPQGDMNFHFMVADGERAFIVENGVAQAVDDNNSVLTNFAVYDSAHSGGGKERYNLLSNGADISSVLWTNAYKPGNNWNSDFANIAEHLSAIEQWASQGDTKEAHRGLTTRGGSPWWQTVHTSEYDFANKTLKVCVQEGEEYSTFSIGRSGDYNNIYNKPQISGVELVGNKTYQELGLAAAEDTYNKKEVDDKINQFSAHYLTSKVEREFVPFATFDALETAIETHTEDDPKFFYAEEGVTPTKNDYCVILADDSYGGKTTRYSYVGDWPDGSFQYQYTINDTAFSQEQWDAINSGITAEILEQSVEALNGKQDKLGDSQISVLDNGPYLKVDSDGKVDTLQVKTSLTKGGLDVATEDQIPTIDNTLSNAGQAADAKKTGDELKSTALQSSVAEEFDSSVSYKQNQVVSYNRRLYRCIEDASAGVLPTDATHWEETTATEPVSYMALDDQGHMTVFDAKTDERIYTDAYRINKDGQIKDASSNIVEPVNGMSLVLPPKVEGFMRDFILSFTIGDTVPTSFSLPPVIESPCGDTIEVDGFLKANTSYRISYSEVDEDVFELHVATSDGSGEAVKSVNGKTGAVSITGEDVQVGGGDNRTIESGLHDTEASITNHKNAKNNPHGVTAEQIGAPTIEEVLTVAQEITDRIDLIETTSHPNMDIVGTPKFHEGNVSGFSQNDYLVFPTEVNVGGNDVDFYLTFSTGSNVTTQQNILDSWCGLAFAIQNGGTVTAASTNGTTFVTSTQAGVVAANSAYRVKFEFRHPDDSSYTVSTYIANGAGDYVLVGTPITLSGPLFPTATYWGGANPRSGVHHIFGGSINLAECYMVWNGKTVWRGYDELPTVKFDPTAEEPLDTAEKIVNVTKSAIDNIKDTVNENNRIIVTPGDDGSGVTASIQTHDTENDKWDDEITFDKGYTGIVTDMTQATPQEYVVMDKSVQTVIMNGGTLTVQFPATVGNGVVRDLCLYVNNQAGVPSEESDVGKVDIVFPTGEAFFKAKGSDGIYGKCMQGCITAFYFSEIPGHGWRVFRDELEPDTEATA